MTAAAVGVVNVRSAGFPFLHTASPPLQSALTLANLFRDKIVGTEQIRIDSGLSNIRAGSEVECCCGEDENGGVDHNSKAHE